MTIIPCLRLSWASEFCPKLWSRMTYLISYWINPLRKWMQGLCWSLTYLSHSNNKLERKHFNRSWQQTTQTNLRLPMFEFAEMQLLCVYLYISRNSRILICNIIQFVYRLLLTCAPFPDMTVISLPPTAVSRSQLLSIKGSLKGFQQIKAERVAQSIFTHALRIE